MSNAYNTFQRREGEERQEDDFYATHPDAIDDLLRMLEKHGNPLHKDAIIWENSCGQGHLVKPLRRRGFKVLATDLKNRGCPDAIHGVDFLADTSFLLPPDSVDVIIMNPPFKHLQEFLEKSLKVAPMVCAFLPLRVMESEERYELLTNPLTAPRWAFVFASRIPCSKNGLFPPEEKSAVAYCWMVWKQGSQNVKEWDIIPPRKYDKNHARI